MHIENPEALRAWLARTLEPMSDADPAYLSKYVLALLKKDKTDEELRTAMTSNLDVFLQKGTNTFVDTLMEALKDNSYLEDVVIEEVEEEEEEMPEEPADDAAVVVSPIVAATEAIESPKVIEEKAVTPSGGFGGNRLRSPLRESGNTNNPRTGSRSRSRSPPVRTFRERRRGAMGGLGVPQGGNSRQDNYRGRRRGLPPSMARRTRRSRSRSPTRTSSSAGRSVLPPGMVGASPALSGSTAGGRRRRMSRSRSRSRSWSPQLGARPSADRPSGRPTSPGADNGRTSSDRGFQRVAEGVLRRQRCIDFDSRGWCVRGDQCPHDHGVDPVVVDMFSGPLGGPPPPLPLAPPFPPPMFGPPGEGGILIPPPPLPPSFMPPMGVPPPMGLDLGLRPNFFPPGPGIRVPFRGGGRGGFRPQGMKRDPKNCTLELRRIPPKQNDIITMSSHFNKFGKVVNVQVNFNNLPDAALITFSQPAEAQAAFKSPEPVLNNRFIKVFWHDGSAHDPELMKAAQEQKQEEEEEQKALEAKEQKAKEIAAIQKQQELILTRSTARKLEEEKKAEAAKIATNLQQQRSLLLQKQIEQQKKLIMKLEQGKNTMSTEEKDKLRDTIRSLQASIENTKRDIAAGTKVAPLKPKTKQEVEKELLDTELELYSKQDSGGDASELERKLANLKRLAVALSYPGAPVGAVPARASVGPMFRGRGGMRSRPYSFRGGRFPAARGSGGYIASMRSLTTLDKRPRKFSVTGFDADEKDELVNHFKNFGAIVNHFFEEGDQTAVFEYKTRVEAETAFVKGRTLGEKELALAWIMDIPPTPDVVPFGGTVEHNGVSGEPVIKQEPAEPVSEIKEEQLDYSDEEDNISVVTDRHKSSASSFDESSLLGEDDNAAAAPEVSLDDELLLLQDDDDEEEVKESRSWRR